MTHRIPPPDPGVYRNVPMEVYNAWDCARSSTLSKLAGGELTPHEIRTAPDDPTSAKGMGNALHVAVWEPQLYKSNVTIWTETKTRKAKACQEAIAQLEDGHYLITGDEAWAVGEMMLALKRSKRCQAYLNAVDERELSVVFWLEIVDPASGETIRLLCKVRLDGWIFRTRAGGIITDLKSTRNAKPDDFTWSIKKFGYHHQGAVYLEGARFAAQVLDVPAPTTHVLLAVQNEPTFRAKPYRLTEAAIETAWSQLPAAVATMARCYETNEWPDIPDTTDDIGLPEENTQ